MHIATYTDVKNNPRYGRLPYSAAVYNHWTRLLDYWTPWPLLIPGLDQTGPEFILHALP